MKKISIYKFIVGIIAMIFSCAGIAAVPATNPDLPISKQMQSKSTQSDKAVKNTTEMMAHLSFAAQAIDLGLKKPAMHNLMKAKTISAMLEKSSPEIVSEYDFKFGKSTYSVNGINRDYYLPVADTSFIEGQFAEKDIFGKNPKMEEKSLAIVHSTLQVNLKDVSAAIISAEKYTKNGKFDDARTALNGVYKNAIRSEEVVSNPVWTVWSNITLAQDFLKQKQFKSARFALNAAKSDIEQIEKDKLLTKNGEEAKVLKSELEETEKTLNEKDLSQVKKLEAKLFDWGQKIKNWL